MRLSYKRGVFRLWIVASGLWLAIVAVVNVEGIFYYIGWHYGLFQQEPSLRAALEKKHQIATASELCKQAYDSACPLLREESAYTECLQSPSPPRNEYECMIAPCDRTTYLERAKALHVAAGFPIDRLTAESCDDFRLLVIVPYLRWTAIVAAILPVFVPWIVWFIGVWIAKGFVAARARPEE